MICCCQRVAEPHGHCWLVWTPLSLALPRTKMQRRRRTSARTASSPSLSPLPGLTAPSSRPTPLKLEAEQLQKLAQLGYEPSEEARVSPPSDLGSLDQLMSPFRSEPHTLLGLLLLGAYVLYSGWGGVPGDDEPEALRSRLGLGRDAPVPEDAAALLRLRSSLWFSGVVFVGYCWLQLKDGYITRPHPAFWRGAHGVMILYLLFVVFLYVQPSAQHAREVLRVLDPTLDVTAAPPENTKEYATDCRVADSAGFPSRILHDTIFDIFFLSHFIGWFCVMIMFRDWWICWLMSIHFEFLEMTFQYMLPNFKCGMRNRRLC
jgi:hypothetical protein